MNKPRTPSKRGAALKWDFFSNLKFKVMDSIIVELNKIDFFLSIHIIAEKVAQIAQN